MMPVEPDVAGEGEHAVAGGDPVAAGAGHVVVHVEAAPPSSGRPAPAAPARTGRQASRRAKSRGPGSVSPLRSGRASRATASGDAYAGMSGPHEPGQADVVDVRVADEDGGRARPARRAGRRGRARRGRTGRGWPARRRSAAGRPAPGRGRRAAGRAEQVAAARDVQAQVEQHPVPAVADQDLAGADDADAAPELDAAPPAQPRPPRPARAPRRVPPSGSRAQARSTGSRSSAPGGAGGGRAVGAAEAVDVPAAAPISTAGSMSLR